MQFYELFNILGIIGIFNYNQYLLCLGILITYLVIIILVSLLSHRKGFENIFSTQKRLPWFFAGFSVFMFNPDTINVLSKMGIVATEGYSGMWIFYSGVFGAGFLPIIFAPLWSRLKFMTDNQFILLRFSGKSAKILHLFRAIYVGYLVAALFIAQIFIGLSKLLVVFFEVSYLQSYLIICGILAFLVLKNSLHLKVRTDLLNGIIYLLAFAIGGFYVIAQFGGFGEVYSKLNTHYEPFIRLIPENLDKTSFGSWPTLLVYFLVQWWSIQILDGAGPEAQRFMNTNSQSQAFKAAFLPLILFSLVFIFHSFVIDAGILMVHETSHLIPQIQGVPDLEAGFLTLYKISMPRGMGVLIFLAFLVAMISFLEAYINWGSSFVVVDLFKTYIFSQKPDRFFSILSYLVMVVIGATGIAIAWYNTHLLGLQKFIFSMAAGVGPVFVLRWFWWRVNAWSQLSAMLSSLILAVGWDLLLEHHDGFQTTVSAAVEMLNMSQYSFKLLCLTLLVSGIWLAVTFLTKPDDHGTLDAFVARVKPGGWWPSTGHRIPKFSTRKLMLVILYPVISILPFLAIWQFKFGTLLVAFSCMVAWIVLIIYTIRSMSETKA